MFFLYAKTIRIPFSFFREIRVDNPWREIFKTPREI